MKRFIKELLGFIDFLTSDLPKEKRNKAYLGVNNFLESLTRLEKRLKDLYKIEKEICLFSQKEKKRKLFKVQIDYLDKTEAFHQHVYSTISSFINVLSFVSDHSFKRGMPIRGVQEFLDFILKKEIHPIVIPLVGSIKKSIEFRAKFIDHPQQHKAHTWMTYAPDHLACIIYYVPGDKGPLHVYDNLINPYDPNFQCPMPYESFYVSPNHFETYNSLCTFIHFIMLTLVKKVREMRVLKKNMNCFSRVDGCSLPEIITPIQKKVLKFLVEKLHSNDIPFQLSGGLAAILYGVKRPLYDIDLVIYQRDVTNVENLFKDHVIDKFCHYQDKYFDIYVMTLEIEGVKVDITQEENIFFFNAEGKKIRSMGSIKNAHILQFDRISFPVENKAELIEYKKIIARDTDLEDVKGLEFLAQHKGCHNVSKDRNH